ncbi:MFS transporter [Cognatishimia sp. SS12]|uniref:MFS transporter n=1 Tax=Cognatishimia sp. SS12 TaxID=2979465 RepID=UPI00232BE50E|nr:MFS transporter [Cognatishimia sp. SS12]MDC0736944.1 MFS transporter [Cognatishimia sp. SS12]
MVEKTPVALIVALWAAGLGAAGQFAKVSVTFEALGRIYPVSDMQLGLIVSVISILGVALGMTAGQLVSSIGFRRMLLTSLGVGAAISVLQASFPAYPILLASRIVEGLAHLGIVVAAPTLIGVLSQRKDRGFFMALWSTMFSVAFAVMAFVAPWVTAKFGTGALYGGHAAYMAVMGLVLAKWLPGGAVKRAPRPGLASILAQHRRSYASADEFAAALGWLFYTLTFVSTMTLLPRYLNPEVRLILLPILPLASTVTSLTLGAWLLARLDAVRLVVMAFTLSAASVAVIALFPSVAVFYVALFAMLGLVQSASFAAIPQLNPSAEAQARANGGMSQMGNLGNTLGTPLMLLAMGSFDFSGLIGMLICCYLSGAIAHLWLARRRRAHTV